MSQPRKKIPTGPTKDDLLSRLGAPFTRPASHSSSPPQATQTSGATTGRSPDLTSDSTPPEADTGSDLSSPESLWDECQPQAQGKDEESLEDDPPTEPFGFVDDLQPDPADSEPIDSATENPVDPAAPALGPEDVAFWLESAGSAEAADLMNAMEPIEQQEQSEPQLEPHPPQAFPGADRVEAMLDDLLSALQLDDETLEEETEAEPQILEPIQTDTPHSAPQLPAAIEPLTLTLSPEASACLSQIRCEYGVPAEILVDVIIRNWSDLPDWAKQTHLGLSHQIQVERLLSGQHRTIQSIERLLAGDQES